MILIWTSYTFRNVYKTSCRLFYFASIALFAYTFFTSYYTICVGNCYYGLNKHYLCLGLGGGAIAGIVVAAVVGATLIIIIVVAFCYMTGGFTRRRPVARAPVPLVNYPQGYAANNPIIYGGGFNGYESRGLPNVSLRRNLKCVTDLIKCNKFTSTLI